MSTSKPKLVLAVLPSIVLIAALELLANYGMAFSYPGFILTITVAYAAFNAGILAGTISTVIVLIYELLVFAEPGRLLVYSSTNSVRLIVALIGTPATMLLVCAVRKRVLASAYKLAEGVAHGEAEQIVEQEHFQLTTILEQLPFGVVIVKDASCKVSFANMEATKLLGHDITEFHPYTYDRMFHANGHTYTPDQWPLIRSFQNGEIVEEEEFFYAGKGGHLRPMWGRSAPVRDPQGKIVAAAMVFHDVSGSRRAELAQLELAAIVTNSDDAIFSVSVDGMILTWNPAAERIFGYSADEIHGKSFAVLVADGRRDEIPPMLEQIRRGESVARFETMGISKSGLRQPGSVRLTPLLDGSGHAKAATVIVRELGLPSLAQEPRDAMVR